MTSSSTGQYLIVNLDDCPCSGKTLMKLVRPMIMAILAQGQRHGYALQRELEERIVFLDGTPDLSGIYRALKEMEARGFVESTWETGESGPAKRCYGLTASGRDCLAKWRQTLSIYREQLDAVLSLMNESKPEV